MIGNYLLITILVAGVFYDVKWRKIPNFLTFGGMILALELNLFYYGWEGLIQTLYGLGLAFCLLFIPFVLRGIGAGDVKFLMVVGAFHGPIFTTSAFVNAALVGGIYSIILMQKNKTLIPFFKKIYYTIFFFTASASRHRSLSLLNKQEQPLSIPYAVAISAGAVMTYWVRWL